MCGYMLRRGYIVDASVWHLYVDLVLGFARFVSFSAARVHMVDCLSIERLPHPIAI